MIIRIKNLRAETLLGAYKEERLARRVVILNVQIAYDAQMAVASDRLQDTLDYADIEQRIVDSLATQKFVLLESLAEHVARLLMRDPKVQSATVEIDKPGALKNADSVAIIHTLSR